MPGVEVGLPGSLAELRREGGVIDEVAARGQRPKIGGGSISDKANARVPGKLPANVAVLLWVVKHPDVLKVDHVRCAKKIAEDGLRVAQRAISGE
jgi:hypothetical protein